MFVAYKVGGGRGTPRCALIVLTHVCGGGMWSTQGEDGTIRVADDVSNAAFSAANAVTSWMSDVQSRASVACLCFMPNERIHIVGYDHNHM